MRQELIMLCDKYSDIMDDFVARNNIVGYNGQMFKSELIFFMMYLAASDGIIKKEEAEMLNEYLNDYLSPEYYKSFIVQNNIYSDKFESTVPQSLVMAVKIDNALLKRDLIPKLSQKLIDLYKAVGTEMIWSDGRLHRNEKFDLNGYINMMMDYRSYNLDSLRKIPVTGVV